MNRSLVLTLFVGLALVGCQSSTETRTADTAKKAEPTVPDEAQEAAKALLGSDVQVLLFGDLAKNGKFQILAANVVPNTPKSTMAGTIVTRAVIAEKENESGKWVELMRADEYLKNDKGYLALTPIQAVTGWRIQYEQSPEKGESFYFTPVKAGSSERTLPIAVRWNPATKRYQSMDPTYQHFLNEAAAIQNPRLTLR